MPLESLARRFGGFSLIGVGNTLLSFGIIFVLTGMMEVDSRLSYVIAYAVTLGLAYVANAWLVFHMFLSWGGFARFCLVYAGSMLGGVLLLHGLMALFPHANSIWLEYVVVGGTTVFNFVFVNRILRDSMKGS